jgi:hypothetical protein
VQRRDPPAGGGEPLDQVEADEAGAAGDEGAPPGGQGFG